MIALVAEEFAQAMLPWLCGAVTLWAVWGCIKTTLEIAKIDRGGQTVPEAHGQ